MDDITILQVTDLHLSPSHPFFIDNWRAATRRIAELPNDLLIASGDLTVNGADWQADLDLAAAELAPLGALVLPGNHDIGECRPDHDQPVTAERLARYRHTFGADYWLRDIGPWRIVGLNSQLMGSGLDEEAHQRNWAEDSLGNGGDGRHLAVFLHKPLFISSISEEDAPDHAIPGEARQWLSRVLRQYGARVVACGHVHQHRLHEYDGAAHGWTPATSFLTRHIFADGQPVLGMALWRLGADGTVSQELPDVPGLMPIQLEEIRGDYPSLRAMPPEAVASAINTLAVSS